MRHGLDKPKSGSGQHQHQIVRPRGDGGDEQHGHQGRDDDQYLAQVRTPNDSRMWSDLSNLERWITDTELIECIQYSCRIIALCCMLAESAFDVSAVQRSRCV